MNRAAIALIVRSGAQVFPVGHRKELLAVTSRKYESLVLPGGTLEPGESPIDAVVREVAEEVNLGLQASHLRMIGESVSQNPLDSTDQWSVTLFFARSVVGSPAHVEDGTRMCWVTFDEFLRRTFFADYYRRHLPGGIDHFPATIFIGA